MNFKTTIVLIIVLAAVGIFLAIDRFAGPREEIKSSVSGGGRQLFDFNTKDVSAVRITRKDGSHLLLKKVGEDWRLAEPIDALAQKWDVESIISQLASLKSNGQIDQNDSTGLAAPQFTVEITGADAKVTKLAVGDKTPLGDLYVRAGDEKRVDVVPVAIYETLDRPTDEWRDKHLVTGVEPLKVQQIRIISGPAGATVMELQKEGNSWQMTRPEAISLDDKSISDLLFAITALQAEKYVPTDSAGAKRGGLDHPQATVWFSPDAPLSTTQPSPTRMHAPNGSKIVIGQYVDLKKQSVYATVEGSNVVAIVSSNLLESALKTPLELRDKRVVTIDPKSVESVTITSDAPATTQPTTRPAEHGERVLKRRPEVTSMGPDLPSTAPATQPAALPASTQPVSQWMLTSANNIEADDKSVDTLLGSFNPLRVTSYVPSSPATTQPSATRYTVTLEQNGEVAGSTVKHTMIFTDPGENLPLVGEYNGLTFELPRTVLDALKNDFDPATVEAPPVRPPGRGGQMPDEDMPFPMQ